MDVSQLPTEIVSNIVSILLGQSWESKNKDGVYAFTVKHNPSPDAWLSLLMAVTAFNLLVFEIDLTACPGMPVPALSFLRKKIETLTLVGAYEMLSSEEETSDDDDVVVLSSEEESSDDDGVIVLSSEEDEPDDVIEIISPDDAFAPDPRGGYGDKLLLRVGQFQHLTDFSLTYAPDITGGALEACLALLQNLQFLSFTRVPAATQCTAAISSLSKLRYLVIERCGLSDDDISPLADQNLWFIHLDGNPKVTKIGVMILLSNKCKPSIVTLVGTGVTDEDREEFVQNGFRAIRCYGPGS